jgi:putative restriction endonuclease
MPINNLPASAIQLLERIKALNVYRSGDRRAPHKPLLLLVAIANLLEGRRELSFNEVERLLRPLLNAYAPPVRSRHQPELPYWHLQSDKLWEVDGAAELERQTGGFPRIPALRESSGHLPLQFAKVLLEDRHLRENVIHLILETHFPESLHDDILAAVGLHSTLESYCAEELTPYGTSRRRDPRFRDNVLRAYEHRCAITGFQAALGGSFFGCEAAHVRWFACEGPDTLDNGLAMEPTLHKLFDAGAWSLTDDRRVLVSAEFTGSDEALSRLRSLHGRPIRQPLPGQSQVSIQYIRWHRDRNKGGVFREPALPI